MIGKEINDSGGKCKEVKKIVLTILTAISFLMAMLFTCIFFSRLTMPFDSEGRHFDEASLTVYHQQSVLVYGLLSLICLMSVAIAGTFTAKIYRAKQ